MSTLLDAGFTRPDAEDWAQGWSNRPEPALVVAEAIAFDDHGVPLAQAINWHQHGFASYEATCLYDIRWKPEESAAVRDLTDDHADLADWVALGLSAAKVHAYQRAKVSHHEVAYYETLGATASLAALETLAALMS